MIIISLLFQFLSITGLTFNEIDTNEQNLVTSDSDKVFELKEKFLVGDDFINSEKQQDVSIDEIYDALVVASANKCHTKKLRQN